MAVSIVERLTLKRTVVAIALVAFAPVLFAAAISATVGATAVPPGSPTTTTTTSTKVATAGATVTRPQTGDTIVNTGLEIVGTAPPAWLVSVSIVDTALDRTGIQHQPNGRVDGSVTSDASGHWVFVPQVKIVPGSFEVSASYTSSNNQVVESAGVRFVVVNAAGESSLPSSTAWWKLAIAVLVLIGVGYVAYREYRRHHGGRRERQSHSRPHVPHMPHMPHMPQHAVHSSSIAAIDESKPLFLGTTDGQAYQRNQASKMQAMEDEMRVIQRALADSAEALERSNRAITALHRQIRHELTESTPEPEVEVVPVAPKRHPTAKRVAHRADDHEGAAVAPQRNGVRRTIDPRLEALEAEWSLPKDSGVKTAVPNGQD
jgi:hypothetical protein